MNPMLQWNQALAWLEEHLTGEIDYNQMARIAGCSQYHFRRMFSYLAGMPLGEYIRCRRLSLAARLLRDGEKVVDCALLLGYESTDAFARAFHAMHGVMPSHAKKADAPLKAFGPMTFQLTVKGGFKMEYRIVRKEAFQIVGYKKRIKLQFEGINQEAAALAEKPSPEAIATLKELCDTEPAGILSVSANFSQRTREGTELDQFLGVATTKEAPRGFDILNVGESDWAVFTTVGPFPKAMQDTWGRIYAEWMPTSGYELTGGPEMVWHDTPHPIQDCRSDIWIPIRKI